jgi:addiction module HigA family antidote
MCGGGDFNPSPNIDAPKTLGYREQQEFEMTKKLPPIHPGEILLEEFLEPMGISQYRLAIDISVPPRRINEIVLGKRSITPDTALRLSLFFGLSERFWMNLQTRYDIEVEKDNLADRLKKEVHVYAPA